MNELIERIRAYLDDNVGDGRHSDAAGANAYELLYEAADALASPTPGGVVKPTEDAVERAAKALAACDYWAWPAPVHLQQTYRDKARAALEAASSPAPGEPVAWQRRYIGLSSADRDWQQISAESVGLNKDYEYRALYASPPTSPPEPPQGVLEALKGLLALCEAGGDPFDEPGRPTVAAARAAASACGNGG